MTCLFDEEYDAENSSMFSPPVELDGQIILNVLSNILNSIFKCYLLSNAAKSIKSFEIVMEL